MRLFLTVRLLMAYEVIRSVRASEGMNAWKIDQFPSLDAAPDDIPGRLSVWSQESMGSHDAESVPPPCRRVHGRRVSRLSDSRKPLPRMGGGEEVLLSEDRSVIHHIIKTDNYWPRPEPQAPRTMPA